MLHDPQTLRDVYFAELEQKGQGGIKAKAKPTAEGAEDPFGSDSEEDGAKKTGPVGGKPGLAAGKPVTLSKKRGKAEDFESDEEGDGPPKKLVKTSKAIGGKPRPAKATKGKKADSSDDE